MMLTRSPSLVTLFQVLVSEGSASLTCWMAVGILQRAENCVTNFATDNTKVF